MHEDANNLYGWAIFQYLSFGRFKQLTQDKVDELDGNNSQIGNPEGCILEDDFEYLEKLHNGYRLPPENIQIKECISLDCGKKVSNIGLQTIYSYRVSLELLKITNY